MDEVPHSPAFYSWAVARQLQECSQELSNRTAGVLGRSGKFRTVDELMDLSDSDLLQIRNLGVKGLEETLRACNAYLERHRTLR